MGSEEFTEFDPSQNLSMEAINNTVAQMLANAGNPKYNLPVESEYIKSPRKASNKGSTDIEITADTTADEVVDSLSDAEKKLKKWEKVNMYLFNHHIFARINNAHYVYIEEKGIYRLITTDVVDEMIKNAFGNSINLTNIELKNVRRLLYTSVRVNCPKLELAKGFVPFADGDYDLRDGSFHEFSPDRAVLSRLPHSKPACDVAPEFVVDSLTDWADGDEETRKLLVQVIAFVLTGMLDSIQQCVLLLGPKQNGKTMFQHLLEYIAGAENTSHLTMNELSERFKTSELEGMRLNCADELKARYIEDTEKFKQLTGQGAITIEKKGKDPVSYLYDGVMCFASNEMPRIKDDTLAVLRRLCIVSFTHTFQKNDTFRREMEKQENIEGYIHLALKEARVLYTEGGGFIEPAKSLPLYEEYKEENDIFGGWLKELGDLDEQRAYIIGKSVEEVYLEYKDYAGNAGCGVMKKITFGKNLRRELGLVAEQSWDTVEGKQRVYKPKVVQAPQ